ncbi:MAG: transcription repressor NadR [Lachnospiraceae bacterium]|nr:transcription repressor NadR [Lachnospiraceae bacterium]
MNGQERRERILNDLAASSEPISGGALALKYNVSRQVIVQDIALLRAAEHNITSTNRGYTVSHPLQAERVFKVSHTNEQVEDELNSIIDMGGTVKDIFVNHKVYGRLRVEMNIRCRRDIGEFLFGINSGKSKPLFNITSNYHYHTVTAENEAILDEIEAMLDNKHMLVK